VFYYKYVIWICNFSKRLKIYDSDIKFTKHKKLKFEIFIYFLINNNNFLSYINKIGFHATLIKFFLLSSIKLVLININ